MASSPPNHASYICIMPRSNLPIIRNTCVLCLVAQLCSTLCNSMDCSPPGSSVHGNLQTRMLGWVTMPPSRGSSQPRDQTQVPTLQAYSLPTEPPGKPKNTGVGSLSILQWIFLTQESKPGSPAFQVDSLPTELSGKPQLYICPLFPFFFRFFSHIGHYRVLNQVPCAIRGPFHNYFEWV